MPDQPEKDRRNQLRNDWRKQTDEAFENSLPMSREQFRELFDYLDEALGETECDDTQRLTREYLQQKGISNSDQVLSWLADNGGYCDCEILNNVEDYFE